MPFLFKLSLKVTFHLNGLFYLFLCVGFVAMLAGSIASMMERHKVVQKVVVRCIVEIPRKQERKGKAKRKNERERQRVREGKRKRSTEVIEKEREAMFSHQTVCS